jgi:hypothetical protein
MAKKKSSKPKGETRTSFMFPSLHEDVVKAVSHRMASPWFCTSDSDRGTNNEYTTHVMGKFTCKKKACPSNGWSSKKVAIQIRGYAENGYICRTSRIQDPEVGRRSTGAAILCSKKRHAA